MRDQNHKEYASAKGEGTSPEHGPQKERNEDKKEKEMSHPSQKNSNRKLKDEEALNGGQDS